MAETISELKKSLKKNTDVSVSKIQILKTKNYKMFKFSTLNREPKHYKKILESIQKNDLTKYNPILVSFTHKNNLVIIDGQNRFMACKSLGLPIYFIISEEAGIEDAPQLNSASKNWSNLDYVKHFANRGLESYNKIIDIQERYGIPLSTVIRISSSQKRPETAIKDGSYVFHQERDIYGFCEHLDEFHDYIPFANKSMFVEALAVCYFNEKYSPERMLDRLSKCSGLINEQPKRELMRKEIEKVYNYGVRSNNVVTFGNTNVRG